MSRCKERSVRLFKFLVLTILVAGLAYGLYEYRIFTAVQPHDLLLAVTTQK